MRSPIRFGYLAFLFILPACDTMNDPVSTSAPQSSVVDLGSGRHPGDDPCVCPRRTGAG